MEKHSHASRALPVTNFDSASKGRSGDWRTYFQASHEPRKRFSMPEVCYIALNGFKFRQRGRATVPYFTGSVQDAGNQEGYMVFDISLNKIPREESINALIAVLKKHSKNKENHIHMFKFDIKTDEAAPGDHFNSCPVDFGLLAFSDEDYNLIRGQLLNVPSIHDRQITVVVTSNDDAQVKDFAIDYSSSEIPFNPSESFPEVASVIDIKHEFFKLKSDARASSSFDPEYDSSKNKSTEEAEKKRDNPCKESESGVKRVVSAAGSSPPSKMFKSE